MQDASDLQNLNLDGHTLSVLHAEEEENVKQYRP